MNQQEIQGLFIKGDRALKTGDYVQATALFEELLRETDTSAPNYFHIQRGLVKAYYQNQAIDKAIALCEQIIANSSSGNRLWGEQFLATITGESIDNDNTVLPSEKEPEPKKVIPNRSIKLKSLAEFKNYCQDNLLPQLKKLEQQRKKTLISILISGIICVFLSSMIGLFLTSFLIFKNSFYIFFVLGLVCLFPLWLIYWRGCIQVYGLGFKREIIEKIVGFIDEHNTLDYASHLLIEDKHHTEICFSRSQLFSNGRDLPDFLEQEDCVFGTIEETDIFFSEIVVERVSSIKERFTARLGSFSQQIGANNFLLRVCLQIISLILNTIIYLIVFLIKLDQLGQHQKNLPEINSQPPKTEIFRGLFFIAKFPKNFENRTFILPNNLENKITFQTWRGQIVNLEDPEFNRMFSVYGDSQLESRYILSTNLMNRLVQFQKKARRNVYISFIEGHVCIAIRYYHNLFEPKLFTSMLSFAPLREYFENLQLMIGIVQDLNLNQKIWQP